MIKIELTVTPFQLGRIAEILKDEMVVPTPDTDGELANPESANGIVPAPAPDTSVVDAPPPTNVAESLFSAEGETADPKPVTTAKVVVDGSPGSTGDWSQSQLKAAATANQAAATDMVELGKGLNGQMIPWDARIHGKAKKKNADDSWRLLQGVDRVGLVPQVEAELVAVMAAAPKPVGTVVETVAQTGDVPPPPPVSTGPSTFIELLPLVTAGKASGSLTDEKINSTCGELGIPNLGALVNRSDLVSKAAELLEV